MWKELFGIGQRRELLELITPRRTFADVILPERTRRALYDALMQIEKHRLIFDQWGLGDRHSSGVGLAFNFAGPPGTGKTICAEAVARSLGKKLYKVRYSEVESCWAGETGKNIMAMFRDAQQAGAVLFFDEADSIAARRFEGMSTGFEREANHTVNILLHELENHEGVVIFATNIATNYDPAFERRIRTHILFEMPGLDERERIWEVQFHPTKTPLAEDVDFRALAEQFAVSGGDIKNAVLKAAQRAAAEPGPDEEKRIAQRHLVASMEEVLDAKKVMSQSLFHTDALAPAQREWTALANTIDDRLDKLEGDIGLCRDELGLLNDTAAESGVLLQNHAEALTRVETRLAENAERQERLTVEAASLRGDLDGLRDEIRGWVQSQAALWETRWQRATIIPMPRWASLGLLALSLAAASLLTAAGLR
jgi:AAA+ superfamily predicted ATPase